MAHSGSGPKVVSVGGADTQVVEIVGVGALAMAPDLVPEGWRTRRGFNLPGAPWDLGAERWICVGLVDGASSAEAALLAALRGAGLVVAIELVGVAHRQFLEDLGRITSTIADAATPELTAEESSLLELLADGCTLAAAAGKLHLSRRTAHRRLTSARDRLGVLTTAEAVTRWSSLAADH